MKGRSPEDRHHKRTNNYFHTAKLLPVYADSVFKFLKWAFAEMFFRV